MGIVGGSMKTITVTTSNTRQPVIRIYENIHDENAGCLEAELDKRQVVRIIQELSKALGDRMGLKG